ncbi:hypothetical protein OCU04_011657 [Sclerotinia nivalis]|uniref:Uncharacterized protein n=1 Tax=Sclerotinia nivalis TaxID=352851 RepID=A0A9X0DFS7_9HELO|nr:hypothetical protein OCU04_011657 [Sclerotinia nivalis]
MPDVLTNCETINLHMEPPLPFHEDLRLTNVVIGTQEEMIGIIDCQATEYVL